MSSIAERVFTEVCLDERVSDGIFKIDNQEHMNALMDHLIKRGIPQNAAVHVTNKMVEGKFPERQAYEVESGRTITWPTPESMKASMADPKNKGKWTLENPNPDKDKVKNEPTTNKSAADKDVEDVEDTQNDTTEEPPERGVNIFDPTPTTDSNGLPIQPPIQPPVQPPVQQSAAPLPSPSQEPPMTPERIAAQKAVVKQILATDDTSLANISTTLNVKETALNHQLNELYKQADKWGFHEAITFLTPYVKP